MKAVRDADAAERFFRQVLQASHARIPRVLTVDKNAAYPPAFEALQQEGILPAPCVFRWCKYLNNMAQQAHRFGKRRVNPGLGFGQIKGMAKRDILAQNRVINQLFGLVASRELASFSSPSRQFLRHHRENRP